MQDFVLQNDNSFEINQCGQVTTISNKTLILIPFYYFPLVLLFVLIATKLAMKSKAVCKIRLVKLMSFHHESYNYVVICIVNNNNPFGCVTIPCI